MQAERHIETVVIGAGQAGLSLSYLLREASHSHVVLERGHVGESWKSRWDSLRVLTPNWTISLPGLPYQGPDPDGFMTKDEVVALLERYAATGAPVETGVNVSRIRRGTSARFAVETSAGVFHANNFVVATGPFNEPKLADWGKGLDVPQFHSTLYKNPAQLPAGAVLVVGAGASGQQIADELARAGRRVFLSVGRHISAPRRYRERDWYYWMREIGYLDRVVATSTDASPGAVLSGSRELDLRAMAALGITLIGRIKGRHEMTLDIAPDLAGNIRDSDAARKRAIEEIDEYIAAHRIDAPPAKPEQMLPDPEEMRTQRRALDLAAEGVSSIVWATGFRTVFDWIELPIFEGDGKLVQERGTTSVPGAYFLGLRRMHKIKSSFFYGVGEDAEHIARAICAPTGKGSST